METSVCRLSLTMANQYKQDLPPKGGFEAIRYRRNLPFRGPGGLVIFGGTALICGFGFWRVGEGNREQREIKRENLWSRHNILPLLQAEADRDEYRRERAALAREAEIMKDVPGWQVGESVYHTDRYVARRVAPP